MSRIDDIAGRLEAYEAPITSKYQTDRAHEREHRNENWECDSPDDMRYLLDREANLREALKDVMGWVDNWSPSFICDDEWPDTETKARKALEQP